MGVQISPQWVIEHKLCLWKEDRFVTSLRFGKSPVFGYQGEGRGCGYSRPPKKTLILVFKENEKKKKGMAKRICSEPRTLSQNQDLCDQFYTSLLFRGVDVEGETK